MGEPDYSTWLPKQQAADAIGVSTKTLEKFTQDGKLQQALWRRPTGGPALAVYHPDDVARLVQERRPGPAAFVLPADRTSVARNGNGSHALASIDTHPSPATIDAPDDWLRRLFAAALRDVTSESSEKLGSKLFLTLAEASTVSGLSERCLRRLIEEGTLASIRDRGLRIRRRDLEAL